ncbi:TPA: hypothetical protein ACH3X1_002911 [Trebouxia sp. C0004]
MAEARRAGLGRETGTAQARQGCDMSSRLSYEQLDGFADGPLEDDPDECFSSDKKPVGFEQLPDHVLLKIFRDIEAVPDSTWGSEDSPGAPYGHVTDDTLTVLIDGYQKRCGLPLVCQRWNKSLSQPSYVWAHLNIGFHELWDVQQRFVDRDLFFSWVRPRAASIKHMQLDFDSWCRQYYQGAFSAVQASRSVATLLELVRGSLQQLKVQDTSFVVNSKMLRSLATATHLRHLQLFGVSSQILVSDALTCVTYLNQLKNLELADSEDHRQAVQDQHPHFFPTQICNLPNLITLHVQSPLVTYIDPAIAALSNLQTLMLNGCSLKEVSSVLVQLAQLHMLCLADNNSLALNKAPDEWWPQELTGLRSLTELDLSSCGVSGVPVSLGRLANLSVLDLGGNWAAPGIMLPHDVACCDSMRSLHMNDCSLKKVPECLCLLSAMEYLGLANNQLVELPQALTGLVHLHNLDLAHNEFHTFPTLLAGLTSLSRISFKGCTQMQIPAPLQMLTSLKNLTALIFTCDLSRHAPRWSADSTSNLISLALAFVDINGRGAKVLRL